MDNHQSAIKELFSIKLETISWYFYLATWIVIATSVMLLLTKLLSFGVYYRIIALFNLVLVSFLSPLYCSAIIFLTLVLRTFFNNVTYAIVGLTLFSRLLYKLFSYCNLSSRESLSKATIKFCKLKKIIGKILLLDNESTTVSKNNINLNGVKEVSKPITSNGIKLKKYCRSRSQLIWLSILLFAQMSKVIHGSPIADKEKIKTMYCLEDTTIDSASNLTLTWSRTKAGDVQICRELCLNWGSIPVTRRCEIDNTRGAFWSTVNEECNIYDGQVLQRTRKLYKLLNSNQTDKDVLSELINISKSFYKYITVADIVLANRILQNLTSLTSECVEVFDNLLLSDDYDTFQYAQFLFNTNVNLLSTLHKCFFLNKVNTVTSSFVAISVKLSNSMTIGWGLNSENKVVNLDSHFTEESISAMVKNGILNEAVVIEEIAMNELQMSDNFHNITLGLVFFFQYDLFVNYYDTENTYRTPIIYSYLEGYNGNLDTILTVIYNPRNANEKCRFQDENGWILSSRQSIKNGLIFCKLRLFNYHLIKTQATDTSPITLPYFNIGLYALFAVSIIFIS